MAAKLLERRPAAGWMSGPFFSQSDLERCVKPREILNYSQMAAVKVLIKTTSIRPIRVNQAG
jgi:hypothetical protein